MDEDRPRIAKYFAGKNIFLTGASGFIGKVLIEKLLRSCPEIGNIYMLLRTKKGRTAEQRLKDITDLELFDILRKQNPLSLKKLIAIEGDIEEINLGISEKNRQMLIDNVNIIYHSAASVRFDDYIRDAIILNTRSTRDVTLLAKEVKHLDVFLHLSTAYTNCDRFTIEEKMYPPHGDWRKSIELAENYDFDVLNVLTEKFRGALPNNYTFTKSLAEHVVYDLCNGQIPSVIIRPSIVIPTCFEPMPGWIENYYGPVGLCIATGKGILRSVYTKPTTRTEYVPADSVVRSILVATWLKGIDKNPVTKLNTEVFNVSNNTVRPVNYMELMKYGDLMYKDVPLNNIVWYPHNRPTGCWYNHFYKLIFYQLLPALLIDGLLKLFGKKPMLFKLHRRIYIANMALQYFLSSDWDLLNDKCLNFKNLICRDDYKDFEPYDWFKDIDTYEYFVKTKLAARRLLLKETDDTIESARSHTIRMWYLYIVWNVLWYLAIFWLVFIKLNIISFILSKMNDVVIYFNTP